jgi:hypothetical protein
MHFCKEELHYAIRAHLNLSINRVDWGAAWVFELKSRLSKTSLNVVDRHVLLATLRHRRPSHKKLKLHWF